MQDLELENGDRTTAPTRIRFGLFEADLKSGELKKSGVKVRIQSQPFKVLGILLEQPGEVVSREDIQRRLWGGDTTVDFDHSLGIAINKLRDALGDSAENPRFIETLARRGYRFIAPVTVAEAQPASPALLPSQPTSLEAESAPLPPKRPPVGRALPWILIIAALAAGLLDALLGRTPPRSPLRISQLTFSGRVLSNLLEVERISSTASDGARIYFSQVADGKPVLTEALIASGEVSTLSLPSGIESPMIGSLSRDGSKLVVRNELGAEAEQSLWIVPALGGNARRISNVLAHDATWMPGGQRILYAFGRALYIVKEDGSDNRKFADLPGRAFWLRWSPTGALLRFTILDSANRSSSLWEIAASGSGLHPLLPGWSNPSYECCGSWSADGKHFVFQSAHGGSTDIWELNAGARWLPFRGAPRQITNGPLEFGAPSTSPEGNRIFFVGVNSRWEILQFSPAGGQFLPLRNNLTSTSLVEYSRDGSWVAWLNASDGSLWRSRADGSERLQLMTPPFHVFMMRWSPTNNQLAVMAQKPGGPWKLYLVDADGGDMRAILDENRDEADPDWSADSAALVFGRVPDVMGAGKEPKAIYQVDLKTGRMSEVPGSSGLFSPRLSPDGRYIAAIRLDQKALMLFDRSTAKWEMLTGHGVGDPVWSHDSQAILFQDFLEAGKPVYRLQVGRKELRQVASLADLKSADVLDYRLIGLAPGDTPLVSAQTSVVNLYSIDLDQR